jgi:hypothetical protein
MSANNKIEGVLDVVQSHFSHTSIPVVLHVHVDSYNVNVRKIANAYSNTHHIKPQDLCVEKINFTESLPTSVIVFTHTEHYTLLQERFLMELLDGPNPRGHKYIVLFDKTRKSKISTTLRYIHKTI